MRGIVAAGALGLLISSVTPAPADGIHKPFKLQNCPSPMSISLPEAFSDADDRLKWIAENDKENFISASGVPALAISPRLKPDLMVIVVDLYWLSKAQGQATPAQFELFKNKLMAAPMSSDDEKLHTDGFSSRFSNDRSVTIMGTAEEMDGGEWSTYHFASIYTYASKCVAATFISSPISSMPAEEFQKVVLAVSIE